MQFKKIRKKFGLIFVVLSAAVMLGILFRNNDLINLFKIINNINAFYIGAAVLSMFMFWFLEAGMLYTLISKFADRKKNLRTFWLAIKVTMIGQYYSNITPMATGGQPVQLCILTDDDISLSSGTAILISKFLLFQIGVTIYSFCLAVYKIKLLVNYYSSVSGFVIAGLTLNMVMLGTVLLIAFNQRVLLKLCGMLFNLLYKLHLIKDVKKVMNKTENFIADYNKSIVKLKEDYWFTIKMYAVTFIQLTIFFSTTFFVYKSFNLNSSNILDIICLQSFLYMAVSFIPTPGTAGASEVGFVLLLGHLFPSNIISTAMLLWRGISYYFSLIFSGFFSFAVAALGKKKIVIS
ncbi:MULTISPECIES: lysylphosphatidylglycerol synthase transmembrane domain-containing protein [unclassified Sedimentibacter]|uniref:lysylphosphatidylglycerol synthase transmembrane domain-containing protein n=1 Tax=unclassified Sedimentibacter TaxID=2649220 RepID=UPI0027E09B87|nr:lysylphosphatidylglycerol synthase transmembrane domain-containing protein [Sedimentibacter sp. MB35-C1]WMJ75996.1 lysylphosphatidylglycerol synthase transmembrane domain-containing protein [Sedimentibacter sp. MB35-C1]